MEKSSLLHVQGPRPTAAFRKKVLLAIYRKQEQMRLWRVRTFALAAAGAAVLLVPVIHSLIIAFGNSHFGSYVSLLFSDGAIALSYWKTLGTSLVESLPVLNIAYTLTLIGILLWSVRAMIRFMEKTTRYHVSI